MQVTEELPTPETTITVQEEPAPTVTPKKRTIPKPTTRATVRVPIVRRSGSTPLQQVPKAHI
jgi:hypothetical protein